MKSVKGQMNLEEWQAWSLNLVKFVAPTLGVFFGLVAQGVPLEKAFWVALLGLYQALSDFFNKLNQGK